MIAAKWAWTGSEWVRNVLIHVSESGEIRDVQRTESLPLDAASIVIPAFHNVHSHAFQWAMRGHSQQLIDGHEFDDFWSWRIRMYELAVTLDPATVEPIALEVFTAMRAAGFATVGEFHYLHHRPDRTAWNPRWAMAAAHVRAAASAGIRLVMIPAAYHRAGFGRPAVPGQFPFVFGTVAEYLDYVSEMREQSEFAGVTFGVAAHSVRAVPPSWLRPIADYAAAHRLPLHIHACEQKREITECIEETGCTPIELLDREGYLRENTVIIHATHLRPIDLEIIARRRAIVGACPTTERDLGDGFCEAVQFLRNDVTLSVGSDSQTLVDPREDLRLLEYHERLRYGRRNMLTRPELGQFRPATPLLRWGARGGATALNLNSGVIAPGRLADVIALDVPAPQSENDASAALDRWLFATREPGIARIWVGGK